MVSYFRQRNEKLNSARFPRADVDPWQPYRTLIEEYRQGASVVVDLGAGPIDALREWLSPGNRSVQGNSEMVISLDRDWGSLRRNPGKFRVVAEAEHLPFREAAVDLLLSRYTFEHLRDPAAMIREAARVLKLGKALVFVTPHRWNYVSLVSRLTPVSFHRFVYRLLGHSGDKLPFCPTYYRLNTPGKIYAHANEVGLRVSQLKVTVGPPEYTKIFPPILHRMVIWFHTLLEGNPRLRYRLGINLFGVLQKQSISVVPLRRPMT